VLGRDEQTNVGHETRQPYTSMPVLQAKQTAEATREAIGWAPSTSVQTILGRKLRLVLLYLLAGGRPMRLYMQVSKLHTAGERAEDEHGAARGRTAYGHAYLRGVLHGVRAQRSYQTAHLVAPSLKRCFLNMEHVRNCDGAKTVLRRTRHAGQKQGHLLVTLICPWKIIESFG
jgi:hypothetical protein